MASASAAYILEQLQHVARLRAAQINDPPQRLRVQALKAYQARRFERGYADLLQDPRYAAATRFFLEELYGPQEFAARDAQFARVVPALVRLFSAEVIATVASLAELHAITEAMDDTTARNLPDQELDAATYLLAWQHAGKPELRDRQIGLTLEIGQALEKFTKKRMFRTSLHLMRSPAKAAGLGALQSFLETGFDAFRDMKGARDFLQTVSRREQALAHALFNTQSISPVRGKSTSSELELNPLDCLP